MPMTDVMVTVETRKRYLWLLFFARFGWLLPHTTSRRFFSWLWRHVVFEYRVGAGEWQRLPQPELRWES
jgi:hypothetical protein